MDSRVPKGALLLPRYRAKVPSHPCQAERIGYSISQPSARAGRPPSEHLLGQSHCLLERARWSRLGVAYRELRSKPQARAKPIQERCLTLRSSQGPPPASRPCPPPPPPRSPSPPLPR